MLNMPLKRKTYRLAYTSIRIGFIIIIPRYYYLMSQVLESSFTLPKGFGKVILMIGALNLQAQLIQLTINKQRSKLFNKEFMEKHFGEVHRRELDQKIVSGGFPDTGNGKYAEKLSYSDWYKFNILQRTHQHYIDHLNWASASVLAAGIVDPNYGLGVGSAYIVGRFLYTYFYTKDKGAHNIGRVIGAAICQIAALVGFGFLLKKEFF